MTREYSLLDQLIANIDLGVRTLFSSDRVTERQTPAKLYPEQTLSESERKHVAALLRVNHTGEVCAQALYQGQALTAMLPTVREKMAQAAREEEDHLAWCEQRLSELNSRPSLTNPLWYTLSLMLGAIAGWRGDHISLGFVVETERQVIEHLQSHLSQLPSQDLRSRALIGQMIEDENHHATMALSLGAADLPVWVIQAMRMMSQVMTTTVYYE